MGDAVYHLARRQVLKGALHMCHFVAAAREFFAEIKPHFFHCAPEQWWNGEKGSLDNGDAHGEISGWPVLAGLASRRAEWQMSPPHG